MAREDAPDGRRSAAIYAVVLVAVWLGLGGAWLATRHSGPAQSARARGAGVFAHRFGPAEGLGPLFNARACKDCHGFPVAGGVGRRGLATELRVGRLTRAGFDPMIGRGGPFARAHSVAELGVACARAAGIPAGANVTSVRNAQPLLGSGRLAAIPDAVLRARAAAERRAGVTGRPNLVRGRDGRTRVGRFGWKAAVPSLEVFVAQALRGEMGVTSPLAPSESLPRGAGRCPGESPRPDVGADVVRALTAYVAALPPPRPRGADPAGAAVFAATGCASCHVPSLPAPGGPVRLYSDLLLHDMGPALDDRVVQGAASGREWRTAPLWGLAERTRYLHDGRATTLRAAVLAHGGEAAGARRRFLALPSARRRALLAFLATR